MDIPRVAWVPPLLVQKAWPLPINAGPPVEVEYDGKKYLIGGHAPDATRAEVSQEFVSCDVNSQHMLCILYRPTLALGRIALTYTTSKSGYKTLVRPLLKSLPNLWISEVDNDAKLGISERIFNFNFQPLEMGGISARQIGKTEYCPHFLTVKEEVAVDLAYLRGAPLGKKRLYFMLLQMVLESTDANPSIRIDPSQFERLLTGQRMSHQRLFQKLLRHLPGICVVNDRRYKIELDADRSILAAPKTGHLEHRLAQRARNIGVSEDAIRLKMGQDDISHLAMEQIERIVLDEAQVSLADWERLKLYLSRAYRCFAVTEDGLSARGEDIYLTKLAAIAKVAATKPLNERGKYLNGAVANETEMYLRAVYFR